MAKAKKQNPQKKILCLECDGHGEVLNTNMRDWKYDEPITCPHCGGEGRVVSNDAADR